MCDVIEAARYYAFLGHAPDCDYTMSSSQERCSCGSDDLDANLETLAKAMEGEG